MTENVISLGSRKPLAEIEREQAAEAAAVKEVLDAKRLEMKGLTLKSIDAIRAAVESDRVGGLVMITQDFESKLFMSDVVLEKSIVPPEQLFAWTGIMEVLKLEVANYATMAPEILIDGTISDPESELEEYEVEE